MSESKNEKPNLGHSPEKVFIYAHNVELLQQCILQMCESSEWPRYISTRLRNSILSGLKRNEVSFILRYALRIQHSVNEAKDLVFKDLAFKNFTLLDTANREALAWMFSYISPAVCDGFTIVAELEDGKFIRYLFKNGKCIIEEGALSSRRISSMLSSSVFMTIITTPELRCVEFTLVRLMRRIDSLTRHPRRSSS